MSYFVSILLVFLMGVLVFESRTYQSSIQIVFGFIDLRRPVVIHGLCANRFLDFVSCFTGACSLRYQLRHKMPKSRASIGLFWSIWG